MPSKAITHLLDVAGDRLCCAEDGPAVAASALLDDTTAAGVVYCPNCARAVLIPIIRSVQARCDAAPLVDALSVLAMTPPTRKARACASWPAPCWSSTAALSRSGGAMPDMSGATTILVRLHGRLRASLPARRRRTRFIELERVCVSVCVGGSTANPEQEEA